MGEKFFVYHKDHSMSEFPDLESLLKVVNMAANPLESIEFIVCGVKLTPLTELRREIVGFEEFREEPK